MQRRDFLKAAFAAAAMPAFNVGCLSCPRARRIARGDKLRIGLVGCGLRMKDLVVEALGENVVAMCDPDEARFPVIMASMKSRGYGGDFSRIRFFGDYNDMYAAYGDELDCVLVATPNHQHAPAALGAIRRGIHVYVEKPMAMTVEEAIVMRREARRYGVATQVGNQGHATEGTRRMVEYVQAGAIGQVHDVWVWMDRVNAFAETPAVAPVPGRLDWDAWLGPAPKADYREFTHPHGFHAWKGWGNGSIGNMGTHMFDPVVWALKLDETTMDEVELEDVRDGGAGSWGVRNTLRYHFPSRAGMDPVTIHWYDGIRGDLPVDSAHTTGWADCVAKREWQNVPPIVEELEKRHGMNLGNLGALVVGEKGALRIGTGGGGFMFVPRTLKKDLPDVPKTLVRERHLTHMKDFFIAARGGRPAGCNFEYSEPLAELVLLGNGAMLAGKGKALAWDGTRFTNDAAANACLHAAYREGREFL